MTAATAATASTTAVVIETIKRVGFGNHPEYRLYITSFAASTSFARCAQNNIKIMRLQEVPDDVEMMPRLPLTPPADREESTLTSSLQPFFFLSFSTPLQSTPIQYRRSP